MYVHGMCICPCACVHQCTGWSLLPRDSHDVHVHPPMCMHSMDNAALAEGREIVCATGHEQVISASKYSR